MPGWRAPLAQQSGAIVAEQRTSSTSSRAAGTRSCARARAWLRAVSRHSPVVPLKYSAPSLGSGTFVAPSSLVQGDVTIGQGSSVWYGAVVRGELDEQQSRVRSRAAAAASACSVPDAVRWAGRHPLRQPGGGKRKVHSRTGRRRARRRLPARDDWPRQQHPGRSVRGGRQRVQPARHGRQQRLHRPRGRHQGRHHRRLRAHRHQRRRVRGRQGARQLIMAPPMAGAAHRQPPAGRGQRRRDGNAV